MHNPLIVNLSSCLAKIASDAIDAPIVLMEPAAGIVVDEFEPARFKDETNVITNKRPDGENYSPTSSPELVQIYCIYTANPIQLLPNSVRWFKDGQPLVADQQIPRERLAESSTPTGYPMLKIRQVRRQDAGSYDCQLANSVGTSERLPARESCRLQVNFRPSVQLRLFRFRPESENSETDTADELELERALVLPNDELVLHCQVLEAQPGRIIKFQWFSASMRSNDAPSPPQQQLRHAIMRPVGVTESERFKLNPLQANFTPTSFACAATNSIGQSDSSNSIDLRLSYTPGKLCPPPQPSPVPVSVVVSSASTSVSVSLSPRPIFDFVCAGPFHFRLEWAGGARRGQNLMSGRRPKGRHKRRTNTNALI